MSNKEVYCVGKLCNTKEQGLEMLKGLATAEDIKNGYWYIIRIPLQCDATVVWNRHIETEEKEKAKEKMMNKRKIEPCKCGQEAQFAIHDLANVTTGHSWEWPPVFCCGSCLAQTLIDLDRNNCFEETRVLLVEILFWERR